MAQTRSEDRNYLKAMSVRNFRDTRNHDDETNTYRTHITNTLYFITGTFTPRKTSAKRSSARPLLVVHSGNTTTGRSAQRRTSSSVSGGADVEPAMSGRCPVERIMESRPTRRKPTMGTRCVGLRAEEAEGEMAAEPVPVRRPGVREMGVDFSGGVERLSVSQTGRRKMGLKLRVGVV